MSFLLSAQFLPITMIFLLPAMFFAMYAQGKVRSAYQKYIRTRSMEGYTGEQVARGILDKSKLNHIAVEMTNTPLGDHYDSKNKVVRLSPEVYRNATIASVGIAAHEAGHALQDAEGYVPLGLRSMVFPMASFGSRLAFPLVIVGLFIPQGGYLMDVGIILYFFAVIFQVVTLPVEFNASTRAIALLEGGRYINAREVAPVRKVLNAAALTYVAATAVAIAQLLRLLILRGARD